MGAPLAESDIIPALDKSISMLLWSKTVGVVLVAQSWLNYGVFFKLIMSARVKCFSFVVVSRLPCAMRRSRELQTQLRRPCWTM